MSVIIILIVISVTVAVLFLGIFIWAVKSGQYDDTYSPSVRMLFDDKKPTHRISKEAENQKKTSKEIQKQDDEAS